MIKISQGYLRFERELSDDDLTALADFIFEVGEEAVRQYFPEQPVYVYARAEEGSTRAWVTLVASGIIFYGELRSGVEQIYNDGRTAVEYVTDQIKHHQNLTPEEIVTRRISSGGSGKILRLFECVESGGISPEQATQQALRVFGEEVVTSPEGESVDMGRYLAREFESASPGHLLPTPSPTEATPAKSKDRSVASSGDNPQQPVPPPGPQTRGVLIWRDPQEKQKKVDRYFK